MPPAALAIIALHVAAALVCLIADPAWLQGRQTTLLLRGAVVGKAVLWNGSQLDEVGLGHGESYRLLTGGFLHYGPMHLAFNMIGLFQAGMFLEPRVGRARFVAIFILSVLGGALGALALDPNSFGAGSSGGVFGLFGALFVAERRGVLGRTGSSFAIIICINLALTFLLPGISIGAHIGGLVTGASTGWLFTRSERRGRSGALLPAACAVLLVVLIGLSHWVASMAGDPIYRV